MYSQIKIFGHPLHPMLVAFPIAFYNGALLSFIIFAINHDIFWFRIGYVSNIAGVVMAAAAALPGFIDLVKLPDESAAKKTGLRHMAFNVVALFLFIVNVFVQMGKWSMSSLPDVTVAIALCAIGVGCTLCAGFLGWKLIQRHHVGVDLTPEQRRYEPLGEEKEKPGPRKMKAA